MNGPWNGSIHYPYKTINEALNQSKKGDEIFIFQGTYEEHLFINKNVNIHGENKNKTILSGSIIFSEINNTKLSQITVTSIKNSSQKTGITVTKSHQIFIKNIIVTNFKHGIIISNESSNIILKENIIKNNKIGVYIFTSNDNLIYGNSIMQNKQTNIVLYYSENNVITQNCISKADNNLQFHTSNDKIKQNYWGNTKKVQILSGYNTLQLFNVVVPWIKILFQPLTKNSDIVNNPLVFMKTSHGSFTIELFINQMPVTTQNFIDLANIDFFDDLVFHRVIDNFVIQGGGYDIEANHKESPFGSIPLETHPEITHVNGALSMARTNDPNSATSQFFICDGAQHRLDGSYAAFGKILLGYDTLEEISSVETTTKHSMNDWPVNDIIIYSADII